MKIIRVLVITLIFIFFTILTQIGGVIYLFSRVTYWWTDRFTAVPLLRGSFRLLSFAVLYLFATFILVPPVATYFGRVRLPFTETDNLKPLNKLTCLLNRNYVRPALRDAAFDVARQMNQQYPGTTVNYLDGNFPFLNRFPLMPHLSHNDGKKLDLAFEYKDANTGLISGNAPSFIGYGICEEPLRGEINTADFCNEKSYWQYSILREIMPQGNKVNFHFDGDRTRHLVNLFAGNASIGKIFIEPHLKTRLKLQSDKIRFHGCGAVRHDDHIHVQLK